MSLDTDKRVGVKLYIDKKLLKKARDRCLNLSAFLRKKLREEVGEEYEAF